MSALSLKTCLDVISGEAINAANVPLTVCTRLRCSRETGHHKSARVRRRCIKTSSGLLPSCCHSPARCTSPPTAVAPCSFPEMDVSRARDRPISLLMLLSRLSGSTPRVSRGSCAPRHAPRCITMRRDDAGAKSNRALFCITRAWSGKWIDTAAVDTCSVLPFVCLGGVAFESLRVMPVCEKQASTYCMLTLHNNTKRFTAATSVSSHELIVELCSRPGSTAPGKQPCVH